MRKEIGERALQKDGGRPVLACIHGQPGLSAAIRAHRIDPLPPPRLGAPQRNPRRHPCAPHHPRRRHLRRRRAAWPSRIPTKRLSPHAAASLESAHASLTGRSPADSRWRPGLGEGARRQSGAGLAHPLARCPPQQRRLARRSGQGRAPVAAALASRLPRAVAAAAGRTLPSRVPTLRQCRMRCLLRCRDCRRRRSSSKPDDQHRGRLLECRRRHLSTHR